MLKVYFSWCQNRHGVPNGLRGLQPTKPLRPLGRPDDRQPAGATTNTVEDQC